MFGISFIRLGLAAMVVATVLAAPSFAGAGKPVDKQLAVSLQRLLDDAVQDPQANSPGTALYVSQPQLGTWAGAAGSANVRPTRRLRPRDTFRAGSIMKPLVATVVLQLAEEGKFRLDDPLPAVLPIGIVARVAKADRITVRMLLNHTSGVPEYDDAEFDRMVIANPERIWTVDELLDRAASMPRAPFEPGEGFAYTNTDYNLLGLVIEHATGRSWRAAVRERIIDRLELERTSVPEPGHVHVGRGDAHGYELVDGQLLDVTRVDPSMAGAAGGNALVTTTRDLSRFLRALLAGRLFKRAETLKEMLTFVPAASESGLPYGYGLGIERYTLPGDVDVIGHFGTAAGYRAFVGHAPAQKLDVSVMINAGRAGDLTPVLFGAFQVMLGAAG